MKLQTFKNELGEFEVVIHDETKMIPNPAFIRMYPFSRTLPIPSETPAAFAARETADREQHEVEAQRLYELEFKAMGATRVIVNEKDFSPKP